METDISKKLVGTNPNTGGLHKALLLIVTLFYFAATALIIRVWCEQYKVVLSESEEIRNFLLGFILVYSIISSLAYFVSLISLGVSFFKTAKGKLTYKKYGIFLNVFFAMQIVSGIFLILNGAKASAMLLQILTPVLMIIAVSCVFISGKIKNRIIIYCMSAAYIVVNLIKIAQNIANKGYSTNMLGMPEFIILFARVLLAGLIVNQTISEYQSLKSDMN